MAQDAVRDSRDLLEEIVVIAQKRMQNVQDVGIAIDAFSAEALQEAGVEDLVDVARLAPNTDTYDIYGNGMLPVWEIRGVGLRDFNSNNTPAAALYLDEVYQSSSANGVKGLYDIASVEILKGPQGGLYGRNTISGAVIVSTKKPSLVDGFSGDVVASYGSYYRADIEGGVNIPLGDKAAARISTKVVRSGDQYQILVSENNSGHGREDVGDVRAQLLVEPSDSVSILLKADYTNNNSETQLVRAIPVFDSGGSVFNGGTGTFCSAIATTGRPDFDTCYFANGVLGSSVLGDDKDKVYGVPFGRLDAESIDLTGRIDWTLPDGTTLTSITGYSDFDYGVQYDFAGLPGPGCRVCYDTDNNIDQISQEIRLASDPSSGGLVWLIGASYSEDKYTELRPILLGNTLGVLFGDPNFVLTAAYDQDTTSYAVFGQAEYPVSDNINLVGSLRYTDETKTFFNRSDNLLSGPSQDGRLEDIGLSIWSGKFGVEWEPTGDLLVYASASKGFKSGGRFGGIPTFPGAVTAYKEEVNYAYEVGFKSRFAENRIQLNGAVFYYDYQDAQGDANIGTSAGGTVTNLALINIGDYEYFGGELALDFQPTDRFFFRAALGYVDADIVHSDRLLEDELTREHFPAEGRPVPNVSELTYNLLARYTQPISASLELTFQADHSYKAENTQSAPADNIASVNFETTDAIELTNLRLALASDRHRWTLGANVTNVFDNRLVTLRNYDAVDGYIEIYTAPRAWSIDLAYKF